MMDVAMPQSYRRRLKTSETGEKLGKCVLCGHRVNTSQKYLTTSEGYTHKICLKQWKEE